MNYFCDYITNIKDMLYSYQILADGYKFKLPLPGVQIENLKITTAKQNNTSKLIITVDGEITYERNLSKYEFMFSELVDYSNVEYSNGLLSFEVKSKKPEVTELQINIPQPSSELHPQILNEDSVI